MIKTNLSYRFLDRLNNLISWANKLEFSLALLNITLRLLHLVNSLLYLITSNINELTLLSLNKSVNNLDFVFDPSFSPNFHVEQSYCRALNP